MKRKSGTIFWLSTILDHEGLDAVDKLLLIGLADHVDERDRCFPSLDRVAQRAGKSYPTAKRRMASLVDRGYVKRTRRHRRDGSLSTYEYELQRGPFGLDPSPSTVWDLDPDQGSDCALGDSPRDQNEPWPRDHLVIPQEVPISEQEEEESDGDTARCNDPQPTDADLAARLDDVIHDVAAELQRLRDLDKPNDLVKQPRPWQAKARKRLRKDADVKRATLHAGHPAGGCIGRPDAHQRTVEALAHVYRAGAYPELPGPRRQVEIADPADVSTNVDTTGTRTPPPASVRAARDALHGGSR